MRGRGGGFHVRPSLFVVLGLVLGGFLPGPAPAPSGLTLPWARPAAGQDAPAPAGTVVGRIVDEATGAPQVGAFVALLDPEGQRRNAVLTDDAGRFVLRVPEPGRYRVRVEGLGVASTFGEFFDFAVGEVREEHVSVRLAALTIEGLEVTGAAQCDLETADGSATIRLWDEARKALEVAQWIDEVGYVYDITSFQRLLSPGGDEVFQEQRSRRTLVGQSPFVSIDAETLMAEGFVVRDSLGASYYGPDASVLLSDVFLSGHCFQAVVEDGRLGLAFRPREGRFLPDIEGTLWFLDEGILDRLEYRYTGVNDYEDTSALGGDIEFRRLPQGAWIVQEWRIRMPNAAAPGPGGGRARIVRLKETGAVVREARSIARIDAVVGERAGAVRGRVTVHDGASARSARVYLSGTSYRTSPGPDGSFLLEGVPPGRYGLVVDHPSLEAMGENPRSLTVEVVADSIGVVDVPLPTREEVLEARCEAVGLGPLDEADPGSATLQVVGGVVRTGDGAAAAGRRVRVWWGSGEGTARGTGRAGERAVGVRSYTGRLESHVGTITRTDSRGAWAVCGAPAGEIIHVDVPDSGLGEAELEAGAGLGAEVTIQPLRPGARRWVELQVSASSEPIMMEWRPEFVP